MSFELAPAADGTLEARALFLGERLDVRAFDQTGRLAENPLVLRAGSRGCAVLFRYGAVVLFGLEPVESGAFLKQLEPLVSDAFPRPEQEDVTLLIGRAGEERVDLDGRVLLHRADLHRLQMVADILAKSVVLAHYETQVAAVFDQIEPLAQALERGGGIASRTKALLAQIGRVLMVQQKMVGRVEVTEKPELLWDHAELERLYLRLEDEYEIEERHRALDRKLELISRTAETVLELVQNRHSLRVEWYIVILIVVEIVLYLYEMFA